MIVGEGPGQKEDETGKPFVGDAGLLLNKMLKAINIERKDIYITNVVNYRHPNNRKPEPGEILRYSNNSVKVMFSRKNIAFIENYDPSLPEIYGNKDQLIQLFINLIKNSAEAINNSKGIIKISTKFEHGNLPIQIFIEDNGNGIPNELKDNIFDAFVTNKINSKGLGLSICAKIIQSHSGSIEFDNINNKTIFKVMFNNK